MSDDQDRRLGSTDYQYVLQRMLMAKGTEFVNHYATTANCCPSRTSVFRGQMVHNTNVTHVNAPGGNYDKFVISGQDTDYLPFWMRQAGYRTECKFHLLSSLYTESLTCLYRHARDRHWQVPERLQPEEL
jgi:arylsulfatase A-like enzyme